MITKKDEKKQIILTGKEAKLKYTKGQNVNENLRGEVMNRH